MCNLEPEVANPRMCRNERQRAQRVSMPPEKRNEINRKRRESYQRKKRKGNLHSTNHPMVTLCKIMPFFQLISNVPYIALKQFVDCDPALNLKNEEPDEILIDYIRMTHISPIMQTTRTFPLTYQVLFVFSICHKACSCLESYFIKC
jgi:hypothetical protein